MDTKVLVSNIQRFCLHDGPGIRTTVFLKGCNLHCPWCANPENIEFKQERYYESFDRSEIAGIYGKWMTLQNIYDEAMKDKSFYCEGGVTFSGGEPLLNMKMLEPLLKAFCQNGISICAETALFVLEKELNIALKYLDTIIVDIKILDFIQTKRIFGGDLKTYLHNIEIVNNSDVDIIYRIPLIKPYTTEEENIDKIIEFLQNKRYSTVELIKGHNLAEKKYRSLNKENYKVPNLSEEELEMIQNKFQKRGTAARVCRL